MAVKVVEEVLCLDITKRLEVLPSSVGAFSPQNVAVGPEQLEINQMIPAFTQSLAFDIEEYCRLQQQSASGQEKVEGRLQAQRL